MTHAETEVIDTVAFGTQARDGALAPLFDFSTHVGQSEQFLRTLRAFAAGPAFRSAVVDELVLRDDFCRRPLRPEDFEFLKFTVPVRARTVARLPSLASHRTLISLYELSSAVPPRGTDAQRRTGFTDFANERNRLYAAQLCPFLEDYAFSYLGSGLATGESAAELSQRLGRLFTGEYQFWSDSFHELGVRNYLQEGLRFILIQRWCLAPSKRHVLAQTVANGHFDRWPAGIAPSLGPSELDDELFRDIATKAGVDRQPHSYWQFYLSTSLAKCNLLHALARRSEQAFALYGALYAAQTEWLAFELAIARCCPGLYGSCHTDPGAYLLRLQRNFEGALRHVLKAHGEGAVLQMGQGLAAAGTLAERGRWDLGEQLTWLASIERYRARAREITRRIDAECPDIDRETFVEPRDMCSTTHVHNDHRLVTVQEGVMQFWGNLGMELQLNEGDMVLIPEGRLHGSTVLSAECTYHQPIIPEAWLQEERL